MEAAKPRYLLSQPIPPPPLQEKDTGPGLCLSEASVSDAKKLGQYQILSGGKNHHLESTKNPDPAVPAVGARVALGSKSSDVFMGKFCGGDCGFGSRCLDFIPDFLPIQ